MTLDGIILNALVFIVLITSAIVVRCRRTAIMLFLPLIALVVAIEFNNDIIHTDHLFHPTRQESFRSFVSIFPLVGLFGVMQGCYASRWRYTQVIGWCVLCYTPIASYLAKQVWFQDYTILTVLAAELLGCLTFAIRGYAFEPKVAIDDRGE